MSGAGQSVSKARFTFLVVMIAAALACGTVPVTLTVPPGPAKPTAAPTLYFSLHQLHFENEVVAFEYPEGLQVHQAGDANWRVHPDVDLGGELLVGLGDPRQSHSERYYRSISIARRLAPVQHTDLARLMTEVYAQLVIEPADAPIGGVPGADGPITVNGHSAIQKVYRIPALYERRDIWIPVDQGLFIVTVAYEWTTYQDVIDFNVVADGILRSLILK
jgi:hypothetical protein